MEQSAGTAWELLDDRERLEHELTEQICSNVEAISGVAILRGPQLPATK